MHNQCDISRLYTKYYHDLRRFLMRKFKDDADIEDLVQDTFIKVYKSVNWHSIKNPKAYLFHAAQNLTIDKIRKKKHEKTFLHDSELEIGSDLIDPEREVLSHEQVKLLTNAISGLSPSVQQAFVLNKLYNLSYKEIAITMSLSVKTVEKHIAKGLMTCVKNTLRHENESKIDNVVTIVSNKQSKEEG
jgi:RNA polymerase sigma factor (sigma-70 family)